MPDAPGDAERSPVIVYTDGACSGNPGPGGWAWAEAPDGVLHGQGGETHTTNQRMEVAAVLDALRVHATGPVVIVSDSTYVVKCFQDRWWEGWLRKGWRNSQRQPVANRDLWEPLISLYRDRQDEITFRWVKGHSGDPMNDLVDALAVAAARDAADGRFGVALDRTAANRSTASSAPTPQDEQTTLF